MPIPELSAGTTTTTKTGGTSYADDHRTPIPAPPIHRTADDRRTEITEITTGGRMGNGGTVPTSSEERRPRRTITNPVTAENIDGRVRHAPGGKRGLKHRQEQHERRVARAGKVTPPKGLSSQALKNWHQLEGDSAQRAAEAKQSKLQQQYWSHNDVYVDDDGVAYDAHYDTSSQTLNLTRQFDVVHNEDVQISASQKQKLYLNGSRERELRVTGNQPDGGTFTSVTSEDVNSAGDTTFHENVHTVVHKEVGEIDGKRYNWTRSDVETTTTDGHGAPILDDRGHLTVDPSNNFVRTDVMTVLDGGQDDDTNLITTTKSFGQRNTETDELVFDPLSETTMESEGKDGSITKTWKTPIDRTTGEVIERPSANFLDPQGAEYIDLNYDSFDPESANQVDAATGLTYHELAVNGARDRDAMLSSEELASRRAFAWTHQGLETDDDRKGSRKAWEAAGDIAMVTAISAAVLTTGPVGMAAAGGLSGFAFGKEVTDYRTGRNHTTKTDLAISGALMFAPSVIGGVRTYRAADAVDGAANLSQAGRTSRFSQLGDYKLSKASMWGFDGEVSDDVFREVYTAVKARRGGTVVNPATGESVAFSRGDVLLQNRATGEISRTSKNGLTYNYQSAEERVSLRDRLVDRAYGAYDRAYTSMNMGNVPVDDGYVLGPKADAIVQRASAFVSRHMHGGDDTFF